MQRRKQWIGEAVNGAEEGKKEEEGHVHAQTNTQTPTKEHSAPTSIECATVEVREKGEVQLRWPGVRRLVECVCFPLLRVGRLRFFLAATKVTEKGGDCVVFCRTLG